MSLRLAYRHQVLVFLCSLTTLTYLDRICISIVGTQVKAEFGLSNEEFGWVLASFSLAYAVFEIPSGALGDRIGPRAVFIRIVLLWSLFTALTGFATGLISLMIFRFLFGIGESGTYPNCMIVMSRWFPLGEMGRSLTWVGIGSQIGSAVAPLLILPIAASYGWRMPFYVNAFLGLIWVLICYRWFKDRPKEMKRIPAKELDYIEKNRSVPTNHHRHSWQTILKSRNVWSLMLMYFCCQWANYFFVAWMPVYLQEGRHFAESEMKQTVFILFITGIAGFLLGGLVVDLLLKKRGLYFARRFVGITGLGLCSLFLFLAAILTNNLSTACCLIAANGCFSFGVMVSYAVCTDIGGNNAGTVTGAMNFFGQMGAFFLALSFGKITDLTHSFKQPLLLVGVVMMVGALLWLKINPCQQISSEKTPDSIIHEPV